MPQIQKPSQPVSQSSANNAPLLFTPGGLPAQGEDNNELTTYFRMRGHWDLNDYILAGPIAKLPTAGGPDTEFIRVAKPGAKLEVQWQSWKKGERATLPQPYLKDGNTILLRNEIRLDNLEIEGDGMNYFISSGIMRYGFLDRTRLTLAYSLPEYINLPEKSKLVVHNADFVPKIMDAAWPNALATPSITQVVQ